MEELSKFGFTDAVSTALVDLLNKSEGLALLLFGSYGNGETWEHSDIDLFLISNLSKKHSAFFRKVDDALLHINVCSEKDFRAYLDKPTGRTIHALFVNGQILIDKTEWIEEERKRLASYPLQNKVLQICERLERVLHYFYQLKKEISFRAKSRTIEGRHEALVKLLEAEKIHEGVYYDKSVLSSVSEKDGQLLEDTLSLTNKAFIKRMQKRVEKLVNSQIPFLVTELKLIDGPITPTNVSNCLGIDLHYMLDAAVNKGSVKKVVQITDEHGFSMAEEAFVV